MFKTIANAFKVKELRIKLLITFGLLLVYVVGAWLPIPGIETSIFKEQVEASGAFLGLLNSVSGGALANGALFALGVGPYITAQIIVQLLSKALPSLERLSKQGEEGQKKINRITRFVALGLAIAQGIAISVGFNQNGALNLALFGASTPSWIVVAFVVTMLVAGAMFTFWLGEKITEVGISQGVSMLIFVGILATAGQSILSNIISIFNGNITKLWELLGFAVALILIFGLIVFIDNAERRIPVQYAKQIKGRKMYGGQSSNIPVKVNGSGVMPIIFATMFITFPQLIMSIFWPKSGVFKWYSENVGAGTWIYNIACAIFILLFSFFYAQLSFQPDEISRQVQQGGGFIPGIRPGKPTAEYLKKVSNRIVLFGALFLTFLFIVPSLLFGAISTGGLINAFSATGLLIVVSAALEFDKQLEAQMLMRNYRGFLK